MFLGNKPPVRGKVHENMPIPPSLSLFAFSVSATCRSPFAHPPYTTHHLFLGTLMSSYIWRSSGALRGGGKWTVDVCTACLIPEQRGQFTRAAQLLTFFFSICFLNRSKSSQHMERKFNASVDLRTVMDNC